MTFRTPDGISCPIAPGQLCEIHYADGRESGQGDVRMIAALFVETGGCYFGLPCFKVQGMVASRHATQRPRNPQGLHCRIQRQAARESKAYGRSMAGRKPRTQRGKREALAAGKPREGQRDTAKISRQEPRKGQIFATGMARKDGLQSVRKARCLQQKPATATARIDARGLRRDAIRSRRRMRYLRQIGCRGEDCPQAICRSLSHFRQDSRTSLWPMQRNAWPSKGQSVYSPARSRIS